MVDASPIEDAEPTYPVELIPGVKVLRQRVRGVGSQLNDGRHNRRVVNYNPAGTDGVVVGDCRHDKQTTDEQSAYSQPSHAAFAEILSSGSTDRGWDFVAHMKGSSLAILKNRDSTAWRNVAQRSAVRVRARFDEESLKPSPASVPFRNSQSSIEPWPLGRRVRDCSPPLVESPVLFCFRIKKPQSSLHPRRPVCRTCPFQTGDLAELW